MFLSPPFASRAVSVLMTVFVFAASIPTLATAQTPSTTDTYRLGPGDVVQLSVWQQPDLDRQLTVRDDGDLVVPLVGAVPAAGRTLPELEADLARRLRAFNRDITEVSLNVSTFKAFEVFIMGSVPSPGSYAFDTVPTVWDAIRAAGGPSATANLRRVRILRPLQSGTSTIITNIAGVMGGTAPTEEMVLLQPGDTVIVPDLQALSAADRETGVHVMGAVGSPGLYPVDEPSPLMTLVLQAGGFSPDANLANVRWVHPTTSGPVAARPVDVKLFLENGQQESNPMIQPGDTIFVERKGTFNFVQAIASSAGVLGLLISVFR